MKYLIPILCLCLPVVAQDAGNSPKKAIAERDADGDGRLSPAEFGGGERIFQLLDKNGDGFLTAEELPQPRRARRERDRGKGQDARSPEQIREMAAKTMERLDKNGDGRLSGDELKGRVAQADRNNDGAVDLFELTVALSANMGRRQRGNDGNRLAQMLKRMDENGDGAVDQSEWAGRPEMFARLDADKDGKITPKEMKRASRGRWRDRSGDALFRRLDKDQDGKIARAEWKMRPEMFDRFDANGDGFITRNEVTPKGGRRRARNNVDLRAGKDSAHFMQKYDKNRDGSVSKEEFPHARRFAEIDSDGNGTLSEAEIRDAMDKRRHEEGYGFMERFDLNNDGKVTREEFTGPAATFERLDQNRDGVIDKSDKPDKRVR